MPFSSIECLACATTVFALLWAARVHRRSAHEAKGYSLPPGPPGHLLVGNLLDVPPFEPWKKYTEWGKQYGDIVYTSVLGKEMICINKIEVMNDLLDKRSQTYSDRPKLVMLGELMQSDNAFPMMQYSVEWRQQRKLCHSTLAPEGIKKYWQLQENVVALYIDALIERPVDFIEELQIATGRVIASATYGLSINPPTEAQASMVRKFLRVMEDTLDMISEAMLPGAFLVDTFPQLKYLPSWLPFNHIHKTAAHGRSLILNMMEGPYEYVKQEIEAGNAVPSFVKDCIEAVGGVDELDSDTEHRIGWAAWSMYAAGADTSSATITVFIYAMALHPEIQAKIKEEITRVVGTGQLPSLADRPHLPYVNAAIKELYRWNPVLPLGIPRRIDKSDFYKGYYIPKDTMVCTNCWAISRDQDSGIPPETFAPERFLPTHVKKVATDPYLYAFGFGRRICPGRFLADNNVFLLVSNLMATVDISKLKDINGVDIPLDPPFVKGLGSYPEPFKVNIKPSSAQAVSAVKCKVASIPKI